MKKWINPKVSVLGNAVVKSGTPSGSGAEFWQYTNCVNTNASCTSVVPATCSRDWGDIFSTPATPDPEPRSGTYTGSFACS